MKHLLRPLIGVASFRRDARMQDALQGIYCCWTLVGWAHWWKSGVIMPDFPTEQREFLRKEGKELNLGEIDLEDAVVFTESKLPNFLHPGIATGEGTIIHAANNGEVRLRYHGVGGVFEDKIEDFVNEETFCGAYIL